MRRWTLLACLYAGACAHHLGPWLAPPGAAVGVSHEPYTGEPAYLAPPRSVGEPLAGRETGRDYQVDARVNAPSLTQGERQDRLRALLAAVDAHVVSLGERMSPDELRALSLTVAEVRSLLRAYTDIGAEADELDTLVKELPSTIPPLVPGKKRRLTELVDLIRLQLMATR